MGKKGRGKRNEDHNLASPLPSSTRNGKAYQRSDVTKEDDQKGISVFRLFGCTSEEKENVAQLSTGTIAAHAVANAAAEEAAATTTHGRINAELKQEQLSSESASTPPQRKPSPMPPPRRPPRVSLTICMLPPRRPPPVPPPLRGSPQSRLSWTLSSGSP